MHKDLFHLQQEMDDEGIILSFRGAITQDVIISLGEALKKQVELKSESISTNMRVFSAFVELLQNIDRYSLDKRDVPPDMSVSYGIVVIGYKDNDYYIHCGNCIAQSRQAELDTLLTRLAGMNAAELKALFKEQRRKDTPETSSGAGLGFIELARNAKDMSHSFSEIGKGVVFFSVLVLI